MVEIHKSLMGFELNTEINKTFENIEFSLKCKHF